jgi:hypothetical protein
MILVIGGGISGLSIASKYNAVVLEEQPAPGGIYSIESISGLEVISAPPFSTKVCNINELVYEEKDLIIVGKKINYIKKKICEKCDNLPNYLIPNNKIIILKNLKEYLRKLQKNIKIINSYPIKIKQNYIITNRGQIIKFNKLINTGSIRTLMRLLNIKSRNLGYVSAFVIIILTRKNNKIDWDLYLNGDSSVSFSHIFKLENENYNLFYTYSFFDGSKTNIDVKRIFNDLNREGIINNELIIGYRARFIKEALLYSGANVPYSLNNIKNCGRLGRWRNISICEALMEVQNC